MTEAANMTLKFRHGDVFIESVAAIPAGVKPAPRDAHGRVVLALGESSGHGHAVRNKHVTSFAVDTAERAFLSGLVDFIEVGGVLSPTDAAERRIELTESMLTDIAASAADVDDLGEAALRDRLMALAKAANTCLAAPAGSVPLRHEYVSGASAEHFTAPLPVGKHRIGIQRQYSPQAILRAAD